MNRIFKMNCREVYNAGKKYYGLKEELESIQKELVSIDLGINKAWKGGDSHNFSLNLNAYISDYDNAIEYLDMKHEVLNVNSIGHSNIATEFQERVKKEEEYE